MFSHVFAIKGSPKTGDGKWVEEDAWLREHHQEYDASYQQTDMEEEEHVEYQYPEQQRRRIRELHEKTKSTMRGTLYWKEKAWPARTYIDTTSLASMSPKLKTPTHRTLDKSDYR
jgi:hypothetical protein